MHAMITELLQKDSKEDNRVNFLEKRQFASPPSLHPKGSPLEQFERKEQIEFIFEDKSLKKKIQSEKKDIMPPAKDLPLMSYSFTTEGQKTGTKNSKFPLQDEDRTVYLTPDYLSQYNITPLATPQKVESVQLSQNDQIKKIPFENFFEAQQSQNGQCISRWFNLDLKSNKKDVVTPKKDTSPVKVTKKGRDSDDLNSSYMTQKLKIESYNMPNLKLGDSSKNIKIQKGLNFSSLENDDENAISGLTVEVRHREENLEEVKIEKSGVEGLKNMMENAKKSPRKGGEKSLEEEIISFRDNSFKRRGNYELSPERAKRGRRDTPSVSSKGNQRELSTTVERKKSGKLKNEQKVNLSKFDPVKNRTDSRSRSRKKRERHFFNLVLEDYQKSEDKKKENPLDFNLGDNLAQEPRGSGRRFMRFKDGVHNVYANKECFVFSFMGRYIMPKKNTVFTMGIKVSEIQQQTRYIFFPSKNKPKQKFPIIFPLNFFP